LLSSTTTPATTTTLPTTVPTTPSTTTTPYVTTSTTAAITSTIVRTISNSTSAITQSFLNATSPSKRNPNNVHALMGRRERERERVGCFLARKKKKVDCRLRTGSQGGFRFPAFINFGRF
jgi:hypothetical protein